MAGMKIHADAGFLMAVVQGAKAKPAPGGMTTKIIAIDGPGGAGKSTLAERLARELGSAQIVETDDFASWDNPFNWWPRLIEDVLEPLARNEPSRYRRSNWGDDDDEAWGEVAPAAFVILEGVSASRKAFRRFLTYSIWVDAPWDLRLSRGLERDRRVRASKGLEPDPERARAQWEQWMAEENDYVRRERPRESADLIVRGDQDL
jgi:uridine kinase